MQEGVILVVVKGMIEAVDAARFQRELQILDKEKGHVHRTLPRLTFARVTALIRQLQRAKVTIGVESKVPHSR